MGAADLAGKVAVVTGGGRGFGKAFGHALAERGAQVVQLDLDHDAANAAAAEIGARAEAVHADVADEDAVERAMDSIAERHGGIDILINNAGIH